MSETKHTPGPWKVVRCNPSPTSGEVMISGSNPGYLAEVRDCRSGDVDANAHLIAAAPELLDALQGLVRELSDSDDEGLIENAEPMIAARVAIDKALGEEQ